MITENEVLKAFPANTFRKYQKETVLKIANAFNSGVKCVLLDAPTGSGKSYINATFCRLMQSFYCTPQLTLIDQLKADKNLNGVFVDIKGKQNYVCYHDEQRTCNIGLCKQYKDFKCDKSKVCPYWIQKLKALSANTALMSFAYFVLEGKTETQFSFGKRKLLVLDESHSIDRHIGEHVNLSISPYSLPHEFYEEVRKSIPDKFKDMNDLKYFIQATLKIAEMRDKEYSYVQTTLTGLSLGMTIAKIKLEDFISKANAMLETLSETEWVWNISFVTYSGFPCKTILAQPLYSKTFMKRMVWDRADYFIISSATLQPVQLFISETGLDRYMKLNEVLHLKVPSTFPPENRPIIDVAQGKLTKDMKEVNLPQAVKMLEAIIEQEKGNNIAVHARSYEFARQIEMMIDPKYKPLLITHNTENRDEKLQEWKDARNSGGKVFVCVAFTEGQDWRYDICRAQVLFKVPFPDITDKKVARRLELHQWNWYRYIAMRECVQAYGRAVRSETDHARFYIIDSSFWGLISACWSNVPDWFKEVVPEPHNKDKAVKKQYGNV